MREMTEELQGTIATVLCLPSANSAADNLNVTSATHYWIPACRQDKKCKTDFLRGREYPVEENCKEWDIPC